MQSSDAGSLPLKRVKRDKWVNIKVSESERDAWQAYAQSQNSNLSDIFRRLIAHETGLKVRLENLPVKKKQLRPSRRVNPDLLRELARIGNNLNQIARWANTYKSDAEAIEVLQALIAIERNLPDAH